MRALAMASASDRGVAADASKLLAHERVEFGPVSVGVDDRMVQAAAKRPGFGLSMGHHGHSSIARALPVDDTPAAPGARRLDHAECCGYVSRAPDTVGLEAAR